MFTSIDKLLELKPEVVSSNELKKKIKSRVRRRYKGSREHVTRVYPLADGSYLYRLGGHETVRLTVHLFGWMVKFSPSEKAIESDKRFA